MALFVYPPISVSTAGGATEATLLQVEANTADTVTELQASNVSLTSMDLALAQTNINTSSTVSELQTANGTLVSISNDSTASAQSLANIESAVPSLATETTLGAVGTYTLNTQNYTQITSQNTDFSVTDQMDTPLLDASVTPIPASGSAHLLVVNSLFNDTNCVVSVDDIGEFIGLYRKVGAGPITLVCVLPLGGGQINVRLNAGQKIYLRNMKNADITSGSIAINFLGTQI